MTKIFPNIGGGLDNWYKIFELLLKIYFLCIKVKLKKNFIATKLKNLDFCYYKKLSKLTWAISKNWIYYAAHNIIKYYLIASYIFGKSINNRARQKIQQNLMKNIKEKKSIRGKVNQLRLSKTN